MKLAAICVLVVALCGCAAQQPKPAKAVVILGNKTTPALCECPQTDAAKRDAAKWKAYAEKLEGLLGIPHEPQQ